MAETLKIKSQRASIRFSLMIGIVCKYLYDLLDLHLYYFYIYFYAVSIVSIFISNVSWGELDEDGLSIKCGLFNHSKIRLKWEAVESINKRTSNHANIFFSTSSSYGIPVAYQVPREIIEIRFVHESDANRIHEDLKAHGPQIFSNKISIKDLSLKIYSIPSKGIDSFHYRSFANALSRSVNIFAGDSFGRVKWFFMVLFL